KFFLLERGTLDDADFSVIFEPSKIFAPVGFPITAKYNDYGYVENIKEDAFSKSLEKLLRKKFDVNDSLEELLRKISHRTIDGHGDYFACMTPESVYYDMCKHHEDKE